MLISAVVTDEDGKRDVLQIWSTKNKLLQCI